MTFVAFVFQNWFYQTRTINISIIDETNQQNLPKKANYFPKIPWTPTTWLTIIS